MNKIPSRFAPQTTLSEAERLIRFSSSASALEPGSGGFLQRWFALSHRTRFAIGLWIVLIGGVLGRVAVEKCTSQSVLPIYLEGGKRWANGEPLYASMPAGLDVYRNPPLVAAITVPFTWLPDHIAAFLWRAIQIGLFALGLVRFLRHVAPPLSPEQRDWFWMLNAVVVLSAFNNAQLNLLLVAAALLGVSAAARGRWWESAFWLVLAAQVKIYPIALVGLVCVVFPKPMIPRTLVLLVAGLLLPCVLAKPDYVVDQYRGFAEAMMADDRSEVPIQRAPRDWSILPRAFLNVSVPRSITLPVSVLAGLAFAAWVALLRKEDRRTNAFCLGMLWMILFGPSTEMNTYSILAPVAAWLAVRKGAGLFAWVGAALLVAAILRASFPSDPATGMTFLQPLGAIALLMAVAVHRGYDRGTPRRRFHDSFPDHAGIECWSGRCAGAEGGLRSGLPGEAADPSGDGLHREVPQRHGG